MSLHFVIICIYLYSNSIEYVLTWSRFVFAFLVLEFVLFAFLIDVFLVVVFLIGFEIQDQYEIYSSVQFELDVKETISYFPLVYIIITVNYILTINIEIQAIEELHSIE